VVCLRSARELNHHRQVPPSPRPLSTVPDGRAEGGLPTLSRESVVWSQICAAFATETDQPSERLFCETLRSVFLGEGSQHREDSLVMGMHSAMNDYGFEVEGYPDRLIDSPEYGKRSRERLDRDVGLCRRHPISWLCRGQEGRTGYVCLL
jgi:hypothetical protein